MKAILILLLMEALEKLIPHLLGAAEREKVAYVLADLVDDYMKGKNPDTSALVRVDAMRLTDLVDKR